MTLIRSRKDLKPTVAIYGGAFDPVHHGHMEVAHELLRQNVAHEVRMTPDYSHMFSKKMVSPEHRMMMLRLATQREPHVKPFDYPIRHHLSGSTHELFTRLLSEPESKHVNYKMVIGQDNADTIHKWKNPEELKRLVPFIVMSRAGSPPPTPDSWYTQGHHQFISINPQYKTSSTKVRELIQQNNPTAKLLLHPEVHDYIQRNGLYRPDLGAV